MRAFRPALRASPFFAAHTLHSDAPCAPWAMRTKTRLRPPVRARFNLQWTPRRLHLQPQSPPDPATPHPTPLATPAPPPPHPRPTPTPHLTASTKNPGNSRSVWLRFAKTLRGAPRRPPRMRHSLPPPIAVACRNPLCTEGLRAIRHKSKTPKVSHYVANVARPALRRLASPARVPAAAAASDCRCSPSRRPSILSPREISPAEVLRDGGSQVGRIWSIVEKRS
jgi:hypothetical protein